MAGAAAGERPGSCWRDKRELLRWRASSHPGVAAGWDKCMAAGAGVADGAAADGLLPRGPSCVRARPWQGLFCPT